jgi:putative endonuclease
MATRRFGTLYVGVTSNIARRAWEHRLGRVPGFTRRYDVKTLVFYEFHGSMLDAIRREKQIKEWKRAWKIALIESGNPDWHDLFDGVPF